MQVFHKVSLKKTKKSQISTKAFLQSRSTTPAAVPPPRCAVAAPGCLTDPERPIVPDLGGPTHWPGDYNQRRELLSEPEKEECFQISRSLPSPALMYNAALLRSPGTLWSRVPGHWHKLSALSPHLSEAWFISWKYIHLSPSLLNSVWKLHLSILHCTEVKIKHKQKIKRSSKQELQVVKR